MNESYVECLVAKKTSSAMKALQAGQFRFQAGASRFAGVYYFPGFPVGRRAVSSAGNGAFEQCFLEFRSVFRRESPRSSRRGACPEKVGQTKYLGVAQLP